MTKKINIYDLLDLYKKGEGKKTNEYIVKNILPEVLEKQQKDGFYSTEDTTEIEEYIKSEFEKEAKGE